MKQRPPPLERRIAVERGTWWIQKLHGTASNFTASGSSPTIHDSHTARTSRLCDVTRSWISGSLWTILLAFSDPMNVCGPGLGSIPDINNSNATTETDTEAFSFQRNMLSLLTSIMREMRRVQWCRNENIKNVCQVTNSGRITAIVVSIDVHPCSKHDRKHCKRPIEFMKQHYSMLSRCFELKSKLNIKKRGVSLATA